MEISNISQESLWLFPVIYDLSLALLLYRFFGKYGLYVAVVLGIVLGNLQGGKVSELVIFGSTFKVSMGAILIQEYILLQMFSMKNTVELRQIGQSCWDS